MKVIDITNLRRTLSDCIDKVNKDQAPLLITRRGEGDAYIVAKDFFSGIEETMYLMRNPHNMKAIDRGIAEIENGDFEQIDLEDL